MQDQVVLNRPKKPKEAPVPAARARGHGHVVYAHCLRRHPRAQLALGPKLPTFTAAFAALAAKDPLVVLARQRFVWKQPHPETAIAARWFAGWLPSSRQRIGSPGSLARQKLCCPGLGRWAFSATPIVVNVREPSAFRFCSKLPAPVALTPSSAGHLALGYGTNQALVLVVSCGSMLALKHPREFSSCHART